MAILKQNKRAWVGNGVGVEDEGGGGQNNMEITHLQAFNLSLTPMKDNNTFAGHLVVSNP